VERVKEADLLLEKAIALDPDSDVAELCRTERSRMAGTTFRAAAGGRLRMDAVMYCIGALKTFAAKPPEPVKKVAFEVALLGAKGFDVNDPAQKYQLRSLPGTFSGLHLVSIMYVAFKLVDPTADVGFDLSEAYKRRRASRCSWEIGGLDRARGLKRARGAEELGRAGQASRMCLSRCLPTLGQRCEREADGQEDGDLRERREHEPPDGVARRRPRCDRAISGSSAASWCARWCRTAGPLGRGDREVDVTCNVEVDGSPNIRRRRVRTPGRSRDDIHRQTLAHTRAGVVAHREKPG
jgi:hypothetical protein